jgi:hypothetical protein
MVSDRDITRWDPGDTLIPERSLLLAGLESPKYRRLGWTVFEGGREERHVVTDVTQRLKPSNEHTMIRSSVCFDFVTWV